MSEKLGVSGLHPPMQELGVPIALTMGLTAGKSDEHMETPPKRGNELTAPVPISGSANILGCPSRPNKTKVYPPLGLLQSNGLNAKEHNHSQNSQLAQIQLPLRSP
jgi:hypothetical protein